MVTLLGEHITLREAVISDIFDYNITSSLTRIKQRGNGLKQKNETLSIPVKEIPRINFL